MPSSNDDENTLVSQTTSRSVTPARACPKCGLIVADTTSVCPQDGTQIFEAPQYEHLLSNKYEFMTVTGSGGMSVVYKARSYETGQVVAIKMLHSLLMNEQSLKRFQQEAKAITSLQHPNIINVHDFGVSEHGQPYMVMDFIDGDTLADVIKEKGGLSLEDSLHRFIQLCDALEHAHDNGVLHRDLKPSNIMISNRDGNFEDARIVDFGIAKLMDKEEQNKEGHLTQTGELFGSPLYMSPEQCRGNKVDARTDIYSMGCVMYETLTGQPPLRGGSMIETIVLQMNEVPLLMSEACPQKRFPEQLEQIIAKALAKDPDDRFQTMTELEYALMQVQPNQQKAAPVKLRKDKVEKKTKSNTPLVATVSTVIGMIATAVAMTLIHHGDKIPSTPIVKTQEVRVIPHETLDQKSLVSLATRIRKIKRKMDPNELIEALKDGDVGMSDVFLNETEMNDAAAQYLRNLHSLKVLELKGPIHNQTLAGFQDFVLLEKLALRDTQTSGRGLAVFASKPKPYLRELYLANSYGMKDDAIDVIAEKLNKLKRLSLKGLEFTAPHFLKLSTLPLEAFWAEDSQIHNDSLAALAKMTNMKELYLGNTAIDDSGIAYLKGLTNLEKLNIGQTGVTDKSMPVLLGMQNLKELQIGQSDVTSASLDTISKLNALTHLDIPNTKIGDRNIAELQRLPNLESLSLYGTNITDTALEHISHMPKLKWLNVGGNAITDAGIAKLEKLKSLEELRLTDCDTISLKAVHALQNKRKTLKIFLTEY